MTSFDSEVVWVQWWCSAWKWVHPQWRAQFAAAHGLNFLECESLMRCRHGEFLQSLGIMASQPPKPTAPMMIWLALNPIQREQVLSLAQRICFASPDHTPSANDTLDLWCHRLAKALRPGLWLTHSVKDSRLVLGAWVGRECWSRLRLTWPPGEVDDLLGDMPDNKLQTLWQAIFWRVTTP